MEANAGLPSGIALLIFSRHPRAASTIEQILRAENIGLKKELRILNRAIHMALCGKVYHHIKAIFRKELIHQLTVADVATHKFAPVMVDVLSNCAEIACIGQQVKNNHANILIFFENILQIVCADKAGSSCH